MSTNIKWSYQKKFQSGEVTLNTGLMLGYKRAAKNDEDGHAVYVIDEQEARVVRRIYREYLAGTTLTRICRGLEADGIKTKLGKDKWQTSVIRNILSNEKYTGNAILGKTFKPDVLSKRRYKNTGQVPMYYAENTHPAIIEKQMFDLVQEEMKQRKDEKVSAVGTGRYTSKYPFSGLLICAECGHKLRRHVRRVGSGKLVPAWACSERVKNGRAVCDSHHVNEETLQRTYTTAIRNMLGDIDSLMEAVKDSARQAIQPNNKAALQRVEQEIIEIQEQVLALHKLKQQRGVSAADYAAQVKAYSEQLQALESKQAELQTTENKYSSVKLWLENFAEHIKSGEIMNADDSMVMKQLVQQIVVGDEGIEIQLQCGVSIKQEYV